MKNLWILTVIVASASFAAPASAQTPSPSPTTTAIAGASGAFDGTWDVTLVCPDAQGALGYTIHLSTHVKNGTLHGDRGLAQTPGYFALDGQLKADGSAILMATGLTGAPDYSVGHVAKLTPYAYHLTSQFAKDRGTGTRDELRPCSATFAKT